MIHELPPLHQHVSVHLTLSLILDPLAHDGVCDLTR